MKSSRGYTQPSQAPPFDTLSIQVMYAARIIQPTPHQEVFTRQNTSYSPPFNSLLDWTDSSSILNPHLPRQNGASSEKVVIQQLLQNSSKILTNGIEITSDTVLLLSGKRKSDETLKSIITFSKFNSPLQTSDVAKPPTPRPYRTDLTPLPSALRPHCLARDRLRLWRPLKSRLDSAAGGIELSENDLDRILHVINISWAQGTRDVYGAGLLVFHVFCDLCKIPEEERCPASPLLIITFISSCAGSYAGTTLGNYIFAIKAWHVLHGATWSMNDAEIKATLAGAYILAPPSSKRPKRAPVTVGMMERIFAKLNLEDPFDAAVASCFSTTLYTVARTGEFTVPSLNAFNPLLHIKPSDVSTRLDRNNLEVVVFHLPKTKCASKGEDVFWSEQSGITDPKANLINHLTINSPPKSGHLFAYRHGRGHRPLTKRAFLDRIPAIAASIGEDNLKGHGIRIGATLEYLL